MELLISAGDAAPAPRRQGRRRRRGRPDPVPRDPPAGDPRARPAGPDRHGADRPGRSRARRPLVGLTLPILLAFGAFFILGFLLYAFVYAAAGSLVSRPEDIQQLAMPLSFVSMAGYFAAIFGMTAINSRGSAILSFVPFFSPYVMLARVMLGHVEGLGDRAVAGILLVPRSALDLARGPDLWCRGAALRPAAGLPDLPAGRDPAGRRLTGLARPRSSSGRRRIRARIGLDPAGCRRPGLGRPDGLPLGVDRDQLPEAAADAGKVRAAPIAGEDPADALGRAAARQGPALAGDHRHGHDRWDGLSRRARRARRRSSGSATSARPSRPEQVVDEVGQARSGRAVEPGGQAGSSRRPDASTATSVPSRIAGRLPRRSGRSAISGTRSVRTTPSALTRRRQARLPDPRRRRRPAPVRRPTTARTGRPDRRTALRPGWASIGRSRRGPAGDIRLEAQRELIGHRLDGSGRLADGANPSSPTTYYRFRIPTDPQARSRRRADRVHGPDGRGRPGRLSPRDLVGAVRRLCPAEPADDRQPARQPGRASRRTAGPSPSCPIGGWPSRRSRPPPRIARMRSRSTPAARPAGRGPPADQPAPGRRRILPGRPTAGAWRWSARPTRATIAEDARRRGRPPDAPGRASHHDRTSTTSTACGPRSNGAGWVYHQVTRLWVVDVESGEARLVHAGRRAGRRAGLVPRRQPDRVQRGPRPGRRPGLPQRRVGRRRRRRPGHPDHRWRHRGLGAAGRTSALAGLAARRRAAGGPGPSLAGGAGSRADVWLMAADGSDSGAARRPEPDGRRPISSSIRA